LDAKASIYHYCNYQERCHKEVRSKLYDLGCKRKEVERLIADLIESNLLNEERYARSIARGKFRMKQWGRNKIIQQLRQNGVSDYCIKKGLSEIDEEEYENTLKKLMMKKAEELKKVKPQFARKQKLVRYLLQKGYEHMWIENVLKKLTEDENWIEP
jgi:regulatory protein